MLLQRQASVNRLCHTARSLVQNCDLTAMMVSDWQNLDLVSVSKQLLFLMENPDERHQRLLFTRELTPSRVLDLCLAVYSTFEKLLVEKSPLEGFVDWLDSMFYRCVKAGSTSGMMERGRQFTLLWNCFCANVIRDLTLHSAPGFGSLVAMVTALTALVAGSFHMMHTMFEDYVIYQLDVMRMEQRAAELHDLLCGRIVEARQQQDLVLPNPKFFHSQDLHGKESLELLHVERTAPAPCLSPNVSFQRRRPDLSFRAPVSRPAVPMATTRPLPQQWRASRTLVRGRSTRLHRLQGACCSEYYGRSEASYSAYSSYGGYSQQQAYDPRYHR